MTIVLADYIVTMDPGHRVVQNGAVAFDETVVEISDDPKALAERYDCEVIDGGRHSVLMPGLVNAHAHLEFSDHKTTLEYGSFVGWLASVMENRDEIIEGCNSDCYGKVLKTLLHSGVTTVGAVSSYGFDLRACVEAEQRIVYFNELIGSNPSAADVIFEDFKERVKRSLEHKSDRFIPALGIHAPYSVYPALIRRAREIAKDNDMPVSAHFMESRSERKWLDSGSGEFRHFFKKFLNTETPITDAGQFLDQLEGLSPMFVHCVHATAEELDRIDAMNGSVIHCPVSNRLLGCGILDLEGVKNREIPYLLGTDGLSSNYSLDLFKEMRSALLMHGDLDLQLLARDLLRSATVNGAEAMGINGGIVEPGKMADLILFKLPGGVENHANLPVQIILHTESVDEVFIGGERVQWN